MATALPFRIHDLPKELLIKIITEVKGGSASNANLHSCLLVCKLWKDIAASVLYRNICLTSEHGNRFINQFQTKKYGHLVRSITIRITWPGALNDPYVYDAELDFQDSEADQEKLRLNLTSFLKLVPLIKSLRNLSCFSLYEEPSYEYSPLKPQYIIDILEVLPQFCTSVEIDARCESRIRGEDPHVCDTLRELLPRLRHFRLRTGGLCTSLFGVTVRGAWQPIQVPNIQTLIVNISHTIQGCYITREERRPCLRNPWISVPKALEALIAKQNFTQKNVKIYVRGEDNAEFDMRPEFELTWSTLMLADMINQETIALPVKTFPRIYHWPCLESNGFGNTQGIVRLLDGRELMIKWPDLDSLMEGQLWRTMEGGARLPAYAVEDEKQGLPSYAAGYKEIPLILETFEQWRNRNPEWRKQICNFVLSTDLSVSLGTDVPVDVPVLTWDNEEKTGVKIIGAELRKGKKKYLAVNRIEEITPKGWRRRGVGERCLELIRVNEELDYGS